MTDTVSVTDSILHPALIRAIEEAPEGISVVYKFGGTQYAMTIAPQCITIAEVDSSLRSHVKWVLCDHISSIEGMLTVLLQITQRYPSYEYQDKDSVVLNRYTRSSGWKCGETADDLRVMVVDSRTGITVPIPNLWVYEGEPQANTRTLDMCALLDTAEKLTCPDTEESPLFGKFPDLRKSRIFPLDQEWSAGSAWVIISYTIECTRTRASLLWYFDAKERMWYDQYGEADCRFPFFCKRFGHDIVRIIPDDLIPDDWKNGHPSRSQAALKSDVDGTEFPTIFEASPEEFDRLMQASRGQGGNPTEKS